MMNALEMILIDMADTVSTVGEAISLAQTTYIAWQDGRISDKVGGIILGACADCADDCNMVTVYMEACEMVKNAIGWNK